MRLFVHKVLPFDNFQLDSSEILKDHPLNPILMSLCILGVNVQNTSSYGIFKKMLYRIQLVLILILLHYWALSDVSWYFRNRIKEVSLAESVTVWASVCTVDCLLLKKKEFLQILTFVASETSKLNDKERRKFRIAVWIICVFVWIFVFVFITQYLIFSDSIDDYKYFSSTPYYFLYDKLTPNGRALVMKLDRCIENFFIQGNLTMIIALYILLCYNAKQWLMRFYSVYNYANLNITKLEDAKDVRNFRAPLEVLAGNVQCLDDIFSQNVAVWLLMILINLCVRILAILNPFSLTTKQMISITVLAFTRAVITLLGVSFAADTVQKEGMKAISKLDYLLRKGSGTCTSSMYHEVQLAFAKYAFYPIQLTVWKFAGLNKSFLMTCIGMMTTYVVICIQLNPVAMQRIAG